MGEELYSFYDYKKTFGNRLKLRRKECGYKTQVDLSGAMGKSCETIRNWEQGINMPEVYDIIALCKLLECDFDYLIGRIDCSTHDIDFISSQTGLSEKAIQSIQNLWLLQPSSFEILNSDLFNDDETPKIFDTLSDLKKAIYSFPGVQDYAEENYLNTIISKQEKSTLKYLNILLESSFFEHILDNFAALLDFEYNPSEEEIEFAKKAKAEGFGSGKSFIKGSTGYIDSDYLNKSFLVSLQLNFEQIRNEYLRSKKSSD